MSRERPLRRYHRRLDFDSGVFGVSIAKPKRPANEDAFVFRAGAFPWMLAVADGVSTSERGQEAARLTLATLWRRVRSIDSGDPSEALQKAVVQAHRAVRSRFDSKGLASLVAALVFPQEGRLIWVSVGSAVVCIRDPEGYRQVNTEDFETTVRQLNGKPMLLNGVPIVDRRTTQGIGIMGGIEPNMGVVEGLSPGAVVCLASDGVKATSLGSFLEETDGLPDLSAVEEFCSGERENSRDDTTLLLLRINRDPAARNLEALLGEYDSRDAEARLAIIETGEGAKAVPARLILRACSMETEETLALRLADLLIRARPRLTREDVIPLLEGAMSDRRQHLYLRLRDIIRRLPSSP